MSARTKLLGLVAFVCPLLLVGCVVDTDDVGRGQDDLVGDGDIAYVDDELGEDSGAFDSSDALAATRDPATAEEESEEGDGLPGDDRHEPDPDPWQNPSESVLPGCDDSNDR
jgi:hypothetical protein